MSCEFNKRSFKNAGVTAIVFILVAALPASCSTNKQWVENSVVLLTFDGEGYALAGPKNLRAGPFTLVFLNKSDRSAAANLAMHLDDHTHQDMLDTFEAIPSTSHAPSWVYSLPGVWKPVPPGGHLVWQGELEGGLYTLVCASLSPFGVWYAAGLTVKD